MSPAATPTHYEPPTPNNTVLLLIDQQEGYFNRIHDAASTRHALLMLADAARMLGLPVVMTTNGANGPNGPQLKELTEGFHDQKIIDRTLINAWLDNQVREAIAATGRSKVIIAGTGLDVCAQLPALAAVADGYDTYVTVDACGRFEPAPSAVTISRLTQAGVALTDSRVIILEMMADNAHPKVEKIYAALFGA